jgi:hypothetical protein
MIMMMIMIIISGGGIDSSDFNLTTYSCLHPPPARLTPSAMPLSGKKHETITRKTVYYMLSEH